MEDAEGQREKKDGEENICATSLYSPVIQEKDYEQTLRCTGIGDKNK